jgi:hypothetical protein
MILYPNQIEFGNPFQNQTKLNKKREEKLKKEKQRQSRLFLLLYIMFEYKLKVISRLPVFLFFCSIICGRGQGRRQLVVDSTTNEEIPARTYDHDRRGTVERFLRRRYFQS